MVLILDGNKKRLQSITRINEFLFFRNKQLMIANRDYTYDEQNRILKLTEVARFGEMIYVRRITTFIRLGKKTEKEWKCLAKGGERQFQVQV